MPKNETKRVDRTSIVVSDSRFSGKPIFVFATEIFCGHKESAVWRSDAGQAEILVVDTYENCIVRPPLDDESIVALRFKWLNETGVSFKGEPMKTEGSLGTVWGRRFTREDRDCYFFRHAFEAHHFSYYSDPTTWMIGYFCAPSGTTMDNASIQRFVSSISLSKDPTSVSIPLETKAITTTALPYADRKYRISGNWAGVSDQISGTFFYVNRASSGSFALNFPDGREPCFGKWNRTRKWNDGTMSGADWEVACRNLPVASGTFYITGLGQAEMRGTDIADRIVRLDLVRPHVIAKDTAETKFSVPISWDGVVSARPVELTYMRNGASGSISFSDKSGLVDCDGLWFIKGEWIAQCTNGQTISGSDFRFQRGTVAGGGVDDNGRSFRFGET